MVWRCIYIEFSWDGIARGALKSPPLTYPLDQSGILRVQALCRFCTPFHLHRRASRSKVVRLTAVPNDKLNARHIRWYKEERGLRLRETYMPQTEAWWKWQDYDIVSHASLSLSHQSTTRLHHLHWHRRRRRVTVFELLRDEYPSFEFPLGSGQSRLVKKMVKVSSLSSPRLLSFHLQHPHRAIFLSHYFFH